MAAARARPADDGRWQVDKKVPVSIIVTLLIYGMSGLWFIQDIKRDVEILKAAQPIQKERDVRQDNDSVAAFALIRDNLREMNAAMKESSTSVNAKLDRLVESQRYVERREDAATPARKGR
ncbi:MAG: hypothetical protein H0W46_04430 [Acidimicrobiia bacterium]|nr:hypothetical protein [Acidimicrobiia bacterium]